MTAALEGGERSAACPGRTLPPGKTLYPFYSRLGGPQGRSAWAENLVPTGIRSRTTQPVVSHYIDWATQPTLWLHSKQKVWGQVHSHKFYSFFHSACRVAMVIESTSSETTNPLSCFITLNFTFKNALFYLCFDKYYSMSVTIIINIFQFL